MAAGSGVANPRAAGSRAAGRANSAPLASRSGMAAASGVANPRVAGSRAAAGFDGNLKNEGGRNMLTTANQVGVDDDVREILPEDYFHEEVGNPLREGGSSTAPTDAELAMRMRLTLAEGKAVLFHWRLRCRLHWRLQAVRGSRLTTRGSDRWEE